MTTTLDTVKLFMDRDTSTLVIEYISDPLENVMTELIERTEENDYTKSLYYAQCGMKMPMNWRDFNGGWVGQGGTFVCPVGDQIKRRYTEKLSVFPVHPQITHTFFCHNRLKWDCCRNIKCIVCGENLFQTYEKHIRECWA